MLTTKLGLASLRLAHANIEHLRMCQLKMPSLKKISSPFRKGNRRGQERRCRLQRARVTIAAGISHTNNRKSVWAENGSWKGQDGTNSGQDGHHSHRKQNCRDSQGWTLMWYVSWPENAKRWRTEAERAISTLLI